MELAKRYLLKSVILHRQPVVPVVQKVNLKDNSQGLLLSSRVGDGTAKAMKAPPIVLQTQAREVAETIVNQVRGPVIKGEDRRQVHQLLHLLHLLQARLQLAIDEYVKTESCIPFGDNG